MEFKHSGAADEQVIGQRAIMGNAKSNNQISRDRVRVFTWHVHGNYLYYLSQSNCDFILPFKKGRPEGYAGKTENFPWGGNVREVLAAEVKKEEFDCILFQSRRNYFEDQYEVLSPRQRMLPKVYLEHDPPRQHPTDTLHPFQDPASLLVHVTYFNSLMWDSGLTPNVVVEHGVMLPAGAGYSGKLAKGIAVINNLKSRGRRLGADIFELARKKVPLDLIGMGSKEMGGLGEVPYRDLAKFISRYRFFFSPIRYSSLALAVCEAMTAGLPVAGLATAELAKTVIHGETGYVQTSIEPLILDMKGMLKNPDMAARLGSRARAYALKRFSISRFSSQWEDVFKKAVEYSEKRVEAARKKALKPQLSGGNI